MIGTLLKGTLQLGKKALALGIQYYVVTTVTEDLATRAKKGIVKLKEQKRLKAEQ